MWQDTKQKIDQAIKDNPIHEATIPIKVNAAKRQTRAKQSAPPDFSEEPELAPLALRNSMTMIIT